MQKVVDNTDDGIENWEQVYMAAATDLKNPLKATITQRDKAAFDYQIMVNLEFRFSKLEIAALTERFLSDAGIPHTRRTNKGRITVAINRQNAMMEFLEMVRPYTVASEQEIEAFVDGLIPSLREGFDTKEDFIEAVESVDKIRGTNAKYTADYFRSEWNM